MILFFFDKLGKKETNKKKHYFCKYDKDYLKEFIPLIKCKLNLNCFMGKY